MPQETKNQEAFDKLQFLLQTQLLQYWDTFSSEQKEHFIDRVLKMDAHILFQQQEILRGPDQKVKQIEPFSEYTEYDQKVHLERGEQLLKEGKAGCLIVAGGQATRLGLPGGAKGCIAVSPIKKKSLFQIFAERTLYASKMAGKKLPLAIMIAPHNEEETKSFFEQHHFFELDPSQVLFFVQGHLPLLDEKGHLFLDEKGLIAEGPDGNGYALHYFYKSEAFEKWREMGITFVNFVQVDNPLADPFDLNLLGFHELCQNDVTVKCTRRTRESEKVGLLVKNKDRCAVLEYSEFPEEEWKMREGGHFVYFLANLSLFCFTMNFIEKVGAFYYSEMPLHAVKKNNYKFERFIFDVLPFADHVKALLYPRERCFAPLKNSSGHDSIESVQAALQEQDREQFAKISGREAPARPFELSQAFYYPTPQLLKKWQGKELPNETYIEA